MNSNRLPYTVKIEVINMQRQIIIFIILVSIFAMPVFGAESSGNVISGADTVWVLICAALVMLMTPAVGLFYGGMVRKKNVLSIITQSFIVLALISIQWILCCLLYTSPSPRD